MSDITVALTIRSFGKYSAEPIELLKSKGYRLLENTTGERASEEQLIEYLKEADGAIAGTEKYPQAVLEKAPQLKVISRAGIAMENVDLEFAKQKGIVVTNTPEAPSWAVAEHTVAHIFSLLKNIPNYTANVRKQDWTLVKGYMLRGKTVGIIGLGRIGQKVGTMLSALGCDIVGYDPYVTTLPDGSPIKIEQDVDEVLKKADILTLHIPFTEDNKDFISKEKIALMKQGSFIINTARGGVLNEEALYEALKNQHLAGAALDVFAKEPYNGPLLTLDNVTFTPHVASNAQEARIAMEMEAVQNLINVLENHA